MASHSMDDLAARCTRILVLSEGEVYLSGAPCEVFSDGERLKAVGLGLPSAAAFAEALRKEGFPLEEDFFSEEQLADAIARALTPAAGGKGEAPLS